MLGIKITRLGRMAGACSFPNRRWLAKSSVNLHCNHGNGSN